MLDLPLQLSQAPLRVRIAEPLRPQRTDLVRRDPLQGIGRALGAAARPFTTEGKAKHPPLALRRVAHRSPPARAAHSAGPPASSARPRPLPRSYSARYSTITPPPTTGRPLAPVIPLTSALPLYMLRAVTGPPSTLRHTTHAAPGRWKRATGQPP